MRIGFSVKRLGTKITARKRIIKIGLAFLVVALLISGAVYSYIFARKMISDVYYRLGQISQGLGNNPDSLSLIEKSYEYNSSDPRVVSAMVIGHMNIGDYSSAKDLLENKLKNLDEEGYLYLTALLKHRERNYQEAEIILRGLVDKYPAKVFYYDALGSMYLDIKDYESAKSIFERGIAINPNVSILHDGLGVAYNALGKADLARDEYAKALELDPTNTGARRNLELLDARR